MTGEQFIHTLIEVIVLAVAAVLILINILLGLTGNPIIRWK